MLSRPKSTLRKAPDVPSAFTGERIERAIACGIRGLMNSDLSSPRGRGRPASGGFAMAQMGRQVGASRFAPAGKDFGVCFRRGSAMSTADGGGLVLELVIRKSFDGVVVLD